MAQASNEVREDTTYQSGCAQDDMTVDTEELPAAISSPVFKPVSTCAADNIVVFDIETTGPDGECQITQLAACRLGSGCTLFSQYVLPTVAISREASNVTGISTGRSGGWTILLSQGKEVPSATWPDAEAAFCAWLSKGKTPCILLAHMQDTMHSACP